MSDGTTTVCGFGDATHVVAAAPFPAGDPGIADELCEPWKCLGWARASEPQFGASEFGIVPAPRFDIAFIEMLNPAVRAIADARPLAADPPHYWALVIESWENGARVRTFVPQAAPDPADPLDDDEEVTRISFAAHAAEVYPERWAIRRYMSCDSREWVPLSCA